MSDFQIYVKIQRKISIIFRTSLIFALLSFHFIVYNSYLKGWRGNTSFEKITKIQLKTHGFDQLIELRNQSINELIKFSWTVSNTVFPLRCIPLHCVKYEDSTIKCLNMRAQMKSIR